MTSPEELERDTTLPEMPPPRRNAPSEVAMRGATGSGTGKLRNTPEPCQL